MSSTDIGRNAEKRVAEELRKQGYKIKEFNWRTRWCEIDVIAEKDACIYFVEVKYRRSSSWGDGFDSVTNSKLDQMARSAEFWIHSNRWNGEVQLMVASVDDDAIELRMIV